MAKRRVDLLFKNFPDDFPHELEKDYPRILHKLMHLWSKDQFDVYIKELMVSDRNDRQGFSRKVISEILFIHKLHDACRVQNLTLPPIENSWESLPPANRSPQSYLLALQRGDLDQVRLYLDVGIPVDYHFEDGGGTPLAIAATNDQAIVASLLIQSGADVNARDRGEYTPLHWAAFFGHTTVASLLLKNGANINALQNTLSTPLMLAVLRNHLSMATLLVKHGANKNLASKDGSPIDVALKKGAAEMIAILRTPAHS
ncbi:MAG: ankyrin repeat domain-containing protein [Pseudomonadota bacterium]